MPGAPAKGLLHPLEIESNRARAYGSAEEICSFGYPAVNCRAIFIRPFGTGAWLAALDLDLTTILIKQRVEQGFSPAVKGISDIGL